MSDTTPTFSLHVEQAYNLIALAEFLRDKDLPECPNVTSYAWSATTTGAFYLNLGDGDQRKRAAAIMRAIGGKWDKKPRTCGTEIDFTQKHPRFKLDITADRDAVCERVVTGTRQVTRTVPAVEAKPGRTVTETVEDVEWDCGPVLGGVVSA